MVLLVVALFSPSSCAEEMEYREECTEERNNGRRRRDKQKPAILEATPVKVQTPQTLVTYTSVIYYRVIY